MSGTCIIRRGAAGEAIARRLKETGEAIQVCDQPPQSVAAEVILLALPDPESMLQAIESLLPKLRPGTLVLDLSASTPQAAQKAAELLSQKGINYVDAPVSGGPEATQSGTLQVVAGGSSSDIAAARPILERLGKVFHVGPTGAGHGMKLAISLLTVSVMTEIAETMVIGQRSGVDMETFYKIVRVSRGNSKVFATGAPRILAGDFTGGTSVDTVAQNLELVDQAGRAFQLPMPTLSATKTCFRMAQSLGYGAEDMSAVVKVMERVAGVSVRGNAVDPVLPERPPVPKNLPRCGFIGLGHMGGPMATNLVKAGVPLMVFDTSTVAVERLTQKGAVEATSVDQLTAECDVIFLSLPDQNVVAAVAMGPDGLISKMRSGTTLIDTSTSLPAVTRKMVAEATPRGVKVVDCPISGGPEGAEAAELTLIVGGEKGDVEAVSPLLNIIGTKIFHMGGPGAGHTMKVLHSAINGITLSALSEALILARKAGVEPETAVAVLGSGRGDSGMFRSRAPRMLAGDWVPGFRAELMHKDMDLVTYIARDLKLPSWVTEAGRQSFQLVRAAGEGHLDTAAIIRPLEELAGITARQGDGVPA